jgi:hypothetical protein
LDCLESQIPHIHTIISTSVAVGSRLDGPDIKFGILE